MTLGEYVVGVFAILVVIFYFIKKRKNDLTAHLKGPFVIPVIGSFLRAYSITPRNFLQKAANYHFKWGRLFRIWAFHRLIVVLSDPKIAEVVLTSQTHITKHMLYNLLKPWLGTGLLISDGQKWHSRRKIITPTFHFKILEQFVEVFDQQSNVLIDQMQKHCDTGKAINVYPFICLAALDIIAETAMGTKINAQTDSTTDYTRAVTDITEIMCMRFLKIHLANEIMFSLFCPNLKRRQTECIRTMHTFTRSVIEERRTALQRSISNSTKEEVSVDDIGSKKRMALLDVLLQSTIEGKPLSNEDIREEVDTFMFEGHDTTTSAISFALTLIARHPEVQSKLYEEIIEKLDDNQSESISYRTLQDLKYTECVIKETLRLYPSVPIVARQLTSDMAYDGGVLPAGTEILISIWNMSNDPSVFPEAELFRPGRHMEDVLERASPFSFVPFSAGPRNCIGQKFAMLEMKCIIAKIVKNFQLLPLGEKVQPSMNIVLRSDNGFQIGLKKRSMAP